MMARISSEKLYAALDEHLNTLDLIHRACADSLSKVYSKQLEAKVAVRYLSIHCTTFDAFCASPSSDPTFVYRTGMNPVGWPVSTNSPVLFDLSSALRRAPGSHHSEAMESLVISMQQTISRRPRNQILRL